MSNLGVNDSMAPISAYAVRAVYEAEVEPRNLERRLFTASSSVTASQSNILQCLALTFATISVASAILAFYWFIKMRRSFRHDLIMLLIQSDMFKALWFMVYPIVTYTQGPISNTSIFCQVNGFFLSVGIEASDISVTMIAIHSALYIIKPGKTGEGGLYPYRHIAYTVWAALPIIMASLAFVRNNTPYASQGAYCYLPVRPLWYSLALSWVPRYLIFIIIFGVYASIYSYVRYKFSGFTKLSKKSSMAPSHGPERQLDASSSPSEQIAISSLPPLIRDSSTPESRHTSTTEIERRKPSVSTTVSYDQVPISPEPKALRFMWMSFVSRRSSQIQSPTPNVHGVDMAPFDNSSTSNTLAQDVTNLPASSNDQDLPSEPPPPIQIHLDQRRDSTPSMVDIFTLLSQRQCEPGNLEPSTLQLVNSHGPNIPVSDMIRTRDKVRRQLRYLFIYPLAYIGMWMVPFVCQILQYDNKFVANLPFGLQCVSTICLCSQAAIDCWLFSSREKPWKHIPRTNGSFTASLRFWSGWKASNDLKTVPGPGRTKDEAVRDAKTAYRRRDEELAERRGESEQAGPFTARSERMWWDSVRMDTTMTPLTEESINPLDNVLAVDFLSAGIPPRTGSNNNNENFTTHAS